MAWGETFEGRRQQERAKLRLTGRYMLANRLEHSCATIDLAACGVAVECGDRGQIGEPIVAYIDQLGCMDGEIARQLQNSFAFKITAPPRKIERLAARIAWLVRRDVFGAPDNRRQARAEAEGGQITVTTPDGEEHFATLIDVSSEGAAINVAIAPAIGSAVTVGQIQKARVVRHFAGGTAVKFQSVLRLRRSSGDPERSSVEAIVSRPYLTTPPAGVAVGEAAGGTHTDAPRARAPITVVPSQSAGWDCGEYTLSYAVPGNMELDSLTSNRKRRREA
jgi:hypothetical protein